MEPVACPPVKRRALAIALQKLEPLPEPRARLEQYQTPADIAADVIFKAYGMRDIRDRIVADLGCGNGILAVGAASLGARRVLAVDVDPEAIDVAKENASSLGVDTEFLIMDVEDFAEEVDTVLMNPPFGAQRKHADTPFLETALRCAKVSYTFHNAETRDYIIKTVQRLRGSPELLSTYKFRLPHTHPFHRKDSEEIEVDLYRIVRTV